MACIGKTVLVLAPLLLGGCATGPQPAVTARVAVLPLRAVGLEGAEVKSVRRAMIGELARLSVPVFSEEEADAALLGVAPECREPKADQQDRCAIRVGGKLGATQVLSGAVGGLGKTFVVQLRLLQVADTAVRTLEETVFGDLAVLTRAVGPIAARLFNPPRPRPWYTRWWVWTLAAAVAVGATAVAVPLSLRGGERYVEAPLP